MSERSSTTQANLVSLFQGGSFFGAGLQLPLTEKFGRKWTILFANVIFIASAFAQTFSHGSVEIFMVGRFLVSLSSVRSSTRYGNSFAFTMTIGRICCWFLVAHYPCLPRRILSTFHSRSIGRLLRHFHSSRNIGRFLDQLWYRCFAPFQHFPVATSCLCSVLVSLLVGLPVVPSLTMYSSQPCRPAYGCLLRA
jgi:hypothetical protein